MLWKNGLTMKTSNENSKNNLKKIATNKLTEKSMTLPENKFHFQKFSTNLFLPIHCSFFFVENLLILFLQKKHSIHFSLKTKRKTKKKCVF